MPVEEASCTERTIRAPVGYSGIGLHTGEVVSLRFLPAEKGEGIRFRRVDLPGQPDIPALAEYVVDTTRSTTLANGEASIQTVEHVLAAIAGLGVDNLIIELDAPEPPVGNGSADVFVELLDRAGVVGEGRSPRRLPEPLYYDDGKVQIIALPSESYRISYTLHYPGVVPLESQYYACELTTELFREEIAPCRSFGLYEEIAPLLERGLIKGCSLRNAVVVIGEAMVSKEGLFFPNEPARHKVLDIVGDLCLVGFPFAAHVIGIKSGHRANVEFAKQLREALR